MKMSALKIIIVAAGLVSVASANDISIGMFRERLFSVGQVPKNEVQNFLKSCDSFDLRIEPEDGLISAWRKWAFGNNVTTVTQVRVFQDKVVLTNWILGRITEDSEKLRADKAVKIYREVAAKKLSDYINFQFENPLPLDAKEEYSYKSPGASVVFEEVFRKDNLPLRWAIRKRDLVDKEHYADYLHKTLVLAKALELPSF